MPLAPQSSIVSCMSAARRAMSGAVGSAICSAGFSRIGCPIWATLKTAIHRSVHGRLDAGRHRPRVLSDPRPSVVERAGEAPHQLVDLVRGDHQGRTDRDAVLHGTDDQAMVVTALEEICPDLAE